MNNYLWSAKNNSFFPVSLLHKYEESGWDLSDCIDVDDEVAKEFMGSAPSGKERAAGSNGMPEWKDLPQEPSDVLLSREISKLSVVYKEDILALNTAYLAAIVSDGPSEENKQQVVRNQLSDRRARYLTEIQDVKDKYPVE